MNWIPWPPYHPLDGETVSVTDGVRTGSALWLCGGFCKSHGVSDITHWRMPDSLTVKGSLIAKKCDEMAYAAMLKDSLQVQPEA